MRLGCLVITLALLVAFAPDLWGQSKEPADQNKQAAQPAPDLRGTEQAPLAVKILPAQDAKEQADKSERERQEKAKLDEKLNSETQRIADYTDRLAQFTFWLFCVAMAQAGLFVWQLLYMRRSMADATTTARNTRRATVASVQKAKIARDTLTKVQRPYVFVFGLARLMTRGDVPGITPFVEYDVANFGQTPAIIENVGAGFYEGELPEAPLRVDDDHNLFVAPVLPPGDKREALRELYPKHSSAKIWELLSMSKGRLLIRYRRSPMERTYSSG
jgi:hypothetical protein